MITTAPSVASSPVRPPYEAVGAPTLSTRLSSAHLTLRPPRTADVPELRRQLRRNAEHLRPWSPRPADGEDPASLTALSKQVLKNRRDFRRGTAYVLVVTPRGDDAPILGRVALGGVMRGVFQNAYLGYWLDAEHQGRGLMAEAVAVATGFALHHAGLHRVQAAVMPRNLRSRRVLEKVGYRCEGLAERYLCIAGVWEDHLLYATTAEEWASSG